MPLASGCERAAPSMTTAPASGRMKPAIMFMSVDLPQPEGPTMAMNSPSPTVKLTSSTTGSTPASVLKLFCSARTSILVRIAPPDPPDAFEHAHETVERQANDSNDDHAGDHEIVAISGVA